MAGEGDLKRRERALSHARFLALALRAGEAPRRGPLASCGAASAAACVNTLPKSAAALLLLLVGEDLGDTCALRWRLRNMSVVCATIAGSAK